MIDLLIIIDITSINFHEKNYPFRSQNSHWEKLNRRNGDKLSSQNTSDLIRCSTYFLYFFFPPSQNLNYIENTKGSRTFTKIIHLILHLLSSSYFFNNFKTSQLIVTELFRISSDFVRQLLLLQISRILLLLLFSGSMLQILPSDLLKFQ